MRAIRGLAKVNQPYKTIIAILYEAGARRIEVLNLRYGDVEEWEYSCKLK